MQKKVMAATGVAAMAAIVLAAGIGAENGQPLLFGLRAEFLLFALTLLGVALFHERTLEVSLTGLTAIVALKFISSVGGFDLGGHLLYEAPILINLFGLLLGFAVLARHFEQSEIPERLPAWLPNSWWGGFVLLCLVFVMSSFLDNIAAAMIGGTLALHVYKGRLDIGFIAAIVAASNAGGSGSVVGDTTTTMMWIAGVGWTEVLHAYIAAVPALLVFGLIAARQQHAYQPIQAATATGHPVQWLRVAAVAMILVGAILANVLLDFPAAGVWAAIALAAIFTKTDWKVVPASLKGSLFLIALVTCASLMPVETLPTPTWVSAFGLGFVSAVFDNIPLTKLALDQGGYDWGMLAYAVGFGGSMMWFGSSAGVAISNILPQARSVGAWLRRGWHVSLGYVVGFFVLLAVLGWNPNPIAAKAAVETPTAAAIGP